MTAVVSIKGLSKSYGRIQALKEVCFEVPAHSIFGLLGPNGAGKTTLFSLVAGFLRKDAGTVEVLGIDTSNISLLQGRLSILPQDAQFQRNVPILEQLVFFELLAGQPHKQAREEVEHSLELVGLKSFSRKRVGSLSHGMLKRLGIAQAFLGHPEVILLDEPTSGLDPASARQIRDLIKQLQERATVIVSSHNLMEIQQLCDHVAILDHGKLVLAGSVDEITRADREFNLSLSRELNDSELERLCSIEGMRSIKAVSRAGANAAGGSVEYSVMLDLSGGGDQDMVVSGLLRSVLDMGITPRRFSEGHSLETHFLEVTGGSVDEV
jgi:ABC-2 type transport system ATP-binding protein